MYASMEKVNAQSPSVSSMCWSMRRFLPIVAFFWILQWGGSDLAGAFIRSKVVCVPPTPVDGVCPKGTLHDAAANSCAPVPRFDRQWSGSSHCFDKLYVIQEATRLGGRLSTIGGISTIIAYVLLGTTMIDAVGRKPMMLLGLCGIIASVACCFILAACGSGGEWLLFLGTFLHNILNVFPVASQAMATDLAGPQTSNRSFAYSAMNALRHIGILIAFGAGFFILQQDLTDYTFCWGIFGVLSICILFFSARILRETAPRRSLIPLLKSDAKASVPTSVHQDGGPEGNQHADAKCGKGGVSILSSAVAGAVFELQAAMWLVMRDPYLRYHMPLVFCLDLAGSGAISITGGYLLGVANLTQSVASLGGVFQPAAIVIGSCFSVSLVGRLGPFYSVWVAYVICAAGFVVVGLGAAFPANCEIWFWIGWCCIVGPGWGILMPAWTAVLSTRTDVDSLGKVFAAFAVPGTLGGMIGSLVWTRSLFDVSVIGTTKMWEAGIGYYVSAACYVAVCIASMTLYRLYIVDGAPVSRASDAMRDDVRTA